MVRYESNTRVFRVRMYGITVCIHRRPRPSRARVRMGRDDGMRWDACMHAFIHSSVVDARGDGRERRTDREDRHRSHRTHRTRLSLSLSRLHRSIRTTNSFIHSFIHSVANERTNEGTNERRDDPRDDALERERRDAI